MGEKQGQGRVALVTGSNGLLGRAICCRLAEMGIDLGLAYSSSRETTEERRRELKQRFGVDCWPLELNVVNPSGVEKAVRELLDSRGRVDMLIATHGVASQQFLRFARDEEIQNAFRINAEGTVYCVRAVLPHMQRQRWGRVVLLGSRVAAEGQECQSVYAASKASLIGLVRSAAREYAKYGITLNVVAPAIVEGSPPSKGESRARLLERYPMGRFVRTEEVAAAVAFLISDDAASITGQHLVIDGARH